MATHRQKLEWWSEYECDRDTMVPFTLLGRPGLNIHPLIVDAATALEAALRATGYPEPIGVTGSYMCRNIAGTETRSLHSFGIAIDVDYAVNRYIPGDSLSPGWVMDERFRITEAQVDAVLSIVNDDGDRLWKWLGYANTFIDPMHFEIDVPPDKCQPAGEELVDYRGVYNVPDADWARSVIDWGLATGIIVVGDNFIDDWENDNYKDGRLWTFLERFDRYLDRKWS